MIIYKLPPMHKNHSPEILQIHNIEKTYESRKALKDFSLNVPKQSILGLLGPNGAGKTTLIRIITQIIAPDKGEIFFKGEKLSSAHTASIGYLPEERGLYKKMKVGEQLIYIAGLKEIPYRKAKELVASFLEKFDLSTWEKRKVEELSKGMQQKVQFIAAVIHHPELLILDEPFSGFDPINSQLLKEEIMKLRDEGTTIIYSTHRMETVEELCDNITLINNGEKLLEGNTQDIRKKYRDNLFFLRAKGTLPENGKTYNLISEKNNHEIIEARLKLRDGRSLNDFIHEVIDRIEIYDIYEELPGIHDIFITRIKEVSA
jgi:ABC-2 type transport system ATP-binding protein